MNKVEYVLLEVRGLSHIHMFLGYDTRKKFYYANSFVPDIYPNDYLDKQNERITKLELEIRHRETSIIKVVDHVKIRETMAMIKAQIKEYNTSNHHFYNEKGSFYLSQITLEKINSAYLLLVKYY